MFGESDRSLKISASAGRSSSGVSGGGVRLSPSVLEDDAGDCFAGEVYSCGVSHTIQQRISRASTYDVFGGSPRGASHANGFTKAPFSVFHPVERVI